MFSNNGSEPSLCFIRICKKNILIEGKYRDPQSSVVAFIDETSKVLTLQFNDDLGIVNVVIVDNLGIIMHEENICIPETLHPINLSTVEKGDYILSISCAKDDFKGVFSIE